MKRTTPDSILFGIVLLVSLSLRIWGVNYDLPYIYHPDEPWPIRIAHQMTVTHDLNPHFFDWPALIIYVNVFIQAIYVSIVRLLSSGTAAGITNPLVELTMGVTYSPEPILVLLGRLLTVALGIGTVAATALAGKEISQNAKVGILAGAMMAVSPTNVSLSRFITPDTYATFFLSVVLVASLLIFKHGRTWAYVIAGIALGLAISSKYNSGIIVITILLGHFLRTGRYRYTDFRLYLVFFLGGTTFLIANPYALLDFREFLVAFRSVGDHYSTGHAGMEGNTLKWYLTYMWQSAGIIYILAFIEILRSFYSRSKEMALLSIFPVVYFAFIAGFIVRNDRTFLPITPFAFVLAASFFGYCISEAKAILFKSRRRLYMLCLAVLLVVTLFVPVAKTIKNTLRLTTVNSRETARVWVNDNLPPGARIAIESYAPFIDPAKFQVQGMRRMIEHESDWFVENGFDYLIFSQGMFGRFYHERERYGNQCMQYDRLFERFRLVKKFSDGNYEVLIYRVK